MIDLDHNATTPVDAEVLEAMLPFLRAEHGNPSSDHAIGRRAREACEAARADVAALVGAHTDEIVFTSGGTESDHLAIRGAAAAAPPDRRDVAMSAIEHPAVTAACAALGAAWGAVILPVTAAGAVDLDRARAAISSRTAIVSVMLANNETGVLQPVAELAAVARARGAAIHTDAAQAAGKIPIDVDALGVDLLTIAGHKLYAPKGVGALYVRRGTALRPLQEGGGQEHGRRAGTEAVHQIVGLGTAARVARRRLDAESARQTSLRDRFQGALRQALPTVTVTGEDSPRLPNPLHLRFAEVLGRALLAALPEVAASAGAACHAGEETPSGVLLAMGITPRDALGAVRFSLGRATTREDVDRAVAAIVAAHERVSRGAG